MLLLKPSGIDSEVHKAVLNQEITYVPGWRNEGVIKVMNRQANLTACSNSCLADHMLQVCLGSRDRLVLT